MSRLLDSVHDFVDQHLKEKSISKQHDAETLAKTTAWLASLGLKPSAALSQDGIKYITYRVAKNLTGPSSPLKYAVEDSAPYLTLIASYREDDSEKYTPQIMRQIAEESFQLFYSSTRPERFDLFNHMSAGELFFVDLDSLIVEAMCNAHVDWEYPQVLLVSQLVRHILDGYLARGGRFQVVEFECNERMWNSSPAKKLMRTVLSHQLETLGATHGFVIKKFANWWDPIEEKNSWKSYLKRWGPEFVVVNDGEQLVASTDATALKYSMQLEDKQAVSAGTKHFFGFENQSAVAATSFRSFVLSLIADRIHVVYSSRQVHKDNAIVAFVVRAHSSKFRPLCDLLPCAVQWWNKTLKKPEAQKLSEDDEAALDKAFKSQARNSREIASILACKELLKSNPDQASNIKLLLITLLAQRDSTVDLRAQPVPVSDGSDYVSFIAQLATPLERWFTVLRQDGSIDYSNADLLDGRFLLVVAKLILDAQGSLDDLLNEEMIKDLQSLWKFVSGEKKAALSPLTGLAPLGAAAAVPELGKNNCGFDLEKEYHPMLEKLVGGTTLTRLHHTDNHEGPLRDWLELDSMSRPFDEPPGLAEAERERRDVESKSAREKFFAIKKANKIKGRLAASISATAASMGQVGFLDKNEAACVVQERSLEEQEAERQKRILSQKMRTDESTSASKKAAEEETAELSEAERKKQEREEAKKEKAAKKKVVTKADEIRRTNILAKANEELVGAERRLNNISGGSDADDLEKFATTCSLPWRKLLADRPDTPQEPKDQAKVWSMFYNHATSQGKHGSEFEFCFGKDKKGAFTAIAAVEKFVTDCEKQLDDILAVLTEDDRLTYVRALYLRAFENHLKFRARSGVVNCHLVEWKDQRSNIVSEHRAIAEDEFELPIKLFQAVHLAYKVIERSKIRVKAEHRDVCRLALQSLDLPETYLRLVDDKNRVWEGESAPFQPLPAMITNADEKPAIRDSAARFQMLRMGHLLERPRPSENDTRVPFNPDYWQRELLDIVDRRGSAVVCAPTSAGKTFISYYCMKDVLKSSNQNIVVYVAPTRALINQAMADVYSRFGSKEYPGEAANVKVYGCLGGADFVQDPFRCQVLITLPETFEALLMSPKYQGWAQRIKYVIFDEIHSIDNGNNGDVWERLLMRVRCPFVALSATIGETQQLCDWLNRVQDRIQAQGVKHQENHVTMVPSSGSAKIQRWSDIEKHAYLPVTQKPFKQLGVRKSDAKKEFHDTALLHIHPLSCVTLEMLQTKFPEDLPFVPRESIELFEVMLKFFKPLGEEFLDIPLVFSIKSKLAALNPDTYFAKELTITQSRGREYERELKAELLRWGQFSKKSYGEFDLKKLDKEDKKHFVKLMLAAVTGLVGHFTANVKSREESVSASLTTQAAAPVAGGGGGGGGGETAPQQHFPDTMEYVQDAMLHGLSTLQRQKKLPAIVFSFEEDDCNKLVEHVVEKLERAEKEYRKTDEFKEYEKKIKAQAAAHTKDLKTQKSFVGGKLETGEDGKVQAVANEGRVQGVDETKSFVVPDVLPQFTFASQFSVVSAVEMKDIERDMSKSDLVLRAFQRGIGIHHNGIKGKVRIHFERLFRTKYLPVIFATQTLALGVHSPCRTVVLAGDHTELNTMQFRQMAGRAGRRGLDFHGHTVFMGVPFRKIQRLMTSDLNVLKGHVQLDCVTELRLQQLHDHEPDVALSKKEKREEAVKEDDIRSVVECLMQEPLFFHGRQTSSDYQHFQVAHAAHSLEFFQRQGLKFSGEHAVNKGEVATLGAMVTRALNIYREAYMGNSAFLLAALMKGGTFDLMTAAKWDSEKGDTKDNKDVLLDLQTVFAYLFGLNSERNLPLEIHRSVLSNPLCFPPKDTNIPECPHSIVLPGLRTLNNKALLSALDRYNREVLYFYSHLMSSLGQKAAAAGNAPGMPLSLPAEKELFPTESSKAGLFAKLAKSKIPVAARSPFVAIAGLGDVFESTEDMVHTLRGSLFIDAAHLPTIDFSDSGRHDKGQILMNACILDYAHERMQVENGQNRRVYLEKFNGLSIASSYGTLNRYCTAVDNLATMFEKVAPHSHDDNPDDESDSFIRSAKGTLLACNNPSCTINDQEDFRRYNAKVIRGPVWRCLDCAKMGKDVFTCEDCRKFGDGKCHEGQGRINHGHKMQPYVEDRFADSVVQLAAHAEEWSAELRAQDVYRKKQEAAMAEALGLTSVSIAKRHIQVKFV